MKIRVKAFAAVREILGYREREMELRDGSSVGDVFGILSISFEELGEMKDSLIFAVNEEYCDEERVLDNNDILAILPPVSGG